jgi:hypothetical protein
VVAENFNSFGNAIIIKKLIKEAAQTEAIRVRNAGAVAHQAADGDKPVQKYIAGSSNYPCGRSRPVAS